MYIWKTVFLSHTTTPRLILSRVRKGYKGDKTLLLSTTVFSGLEVQTIGEIKRDLNHLTYMFNGTTSLHMEDVSLSHTTPELILIRVKRNYKDNKAFH